MMAVWYIMNRFKLIFSGVLSNNIGRLVAFNSLLLSSDWISSMNRTVCVCLCVYACAYHLWGIEVEVGVNRIVDARTKKNRMISFS